MAWDHMMANQEIGYMAFYFINFFLFIHLIIRINYFFLLLFSALFNNFIYKFNETKNE